METLTTKRENFRVKLHSIDNDFNEWLEVKKLSKEFKINISSEGQKDLKNVYKQMEEIWKKKCFQKRDIRIIKET